MFAWDVSRKLRGNPAKLWQLQDGKLVLRQEEDPTRGKVGRGT